jgi:hypothetical protein
MMRFISAVILFLITQQTSQPPASLEGTTVRVGTYEPGPRARVTLVRHQAAECHADHGHIGVRRPLRIQSRRRAARSHRTEASLS